MRRLLRFVASALCVISVAGAESPARAATVQTLAAFGDLDANGLPLGVFSGLTAGSRSKVAFRAPIHMILTRTGSTLAEIVRTGDPLPAPLVGSFSGVFDPSINDAGRIAFRGRPGQDLFLYDPNGMAISQIHSGPMRFPPDINNAGDIAFIIGNDDIYLWDSGTMTSSLVVPNGAALPGGGVLQRVGQRVVLSDGGVAAFEVEASGANDGFFTWDAINGLRVVAKQGAPTPIGGTYNAGSFTPGSSIVINANGKVAFAAAIDGGPAAAAVFLYDPNGPVTTVVAQTGDLVGGNALTGMGVVGVDPNDDVVFVGGFGAASELVRASGGVLTALTSGFAGAQEFAPRLTTSGRVVWRSTPDILQYDGAITTVLSPASITPLGQGFSGFEPTINNADVVAFRATRSPVYQLARGPAVPIATVGDPSPRSGTFDAIFDHRFKRKLVFQATDGAGDLLVVSERTGLEKVVGSGDAAPSGGTFDSFGSFDVSGGTVVFDGFTSGAPFEGLFRASTRTGAVTTVLPSGTPDPGDPNATLTSFLTVRLGGPNVVFAASTNTGGGGVFLVGRSGAVQTIVRAGDPVPGGVGTFAAPEFSTIAVSGRSVLFSTDEGLFVWRRGQLTKVMAAGDPTPVGGTFFGLSAPAAIAISGRTVGFTAGVDTGGVDDGFFLSRNGVITSLVLSGDVSPLGGTFITVDVGEPIALFGRTGIFQANLTGASAPFGIFKAVP